MYFIVNWCLRRLRTMLHRPSCSECGTTLALHQWREGTQPGYVCTPCGEEYGYREWLTYAPIVPRK